MDYGMRVSKDGVDVKSAADKDLIFNSAFNSLKIKKEVFDASTVNVPSGYTATWAGVAENLDHNLGYAPSHMCFYKDIFYGGNQYWSCDGGGRYAIPIYDPSSSVTAGTLLGDDSSHRAWSDSSKMNIQITNFSGVTRRYNIFSYFLIEDNA